MPTESMQELIEESIKDIYSAEKQLSKALPKLVKAAQNPRLKDSLQNHLAETQEQIKRIEELAKQMGIKPGGMLCKGMQGIVEEANEHLKGAKPSPVTDAMIIGLAQKNEHYEICGYGTVIEYMKAAGMESQIELLQQNMAEEEKTDKLLSQLAESEINRQAASEAPAEPAKKTARSTSSRSSAGKTGTSTKSGSGSKTTPREKVSVR